MAVKRPVVRRSSPLRRLLLPVLAVALAAPAVLAAAPVAAAPGTGSTPAAPAVVASGDDPEIAVVHTNLVIGHAGPSGRPARGATVEVAGRGANLLLSAAPDQVFALRARRDGHWGDWLELRAETDEGPDGAAPTSGGSPEGRTLRQLAYGPLRVEGAEAVEIVLVSGDATRLEVTFLSDVAEDPAGPRVLGRSQVTGAGRPSIIGRSSWTTEGWATWNPGCGSGPSYADDIRAVVVHHTVNGNGYGADDVDDLLRSIWYAHVRINGWCDIGYNFVVDRFGRIWEARTGGVDQPVIGGHAKGFNTSTVGIALLGQHQPGASPAAAVPSAAAADAVAQLAGWKADIHGIDPAGTTWLRNQSTSGPQKHASNTWHLVPTILGHRDLGLTSCPGNYGLDLARGLVPTLTASRQTTPPYVREGWRPADAGPGFVTLDGRGGIRPAGSATLPGIGASGTGVAAPAGSVALAAERDGTTTRGYVLASDGTLTAFGGLPAVPGQPAGGATPVDVALAAGGAGGWVVSADGAVHGFGSVGSPSVQGGEAVVAADLDGGGNGYLVEADGGLRAVGSAPPLSSPVGLRAVDIAVRPTGDSGWILASDGALYSFGGAARMAVPGARGRTPRAVLASGSGAGGWVMTADGQLWPFGQERLVFPIATDTASGDALDVAVTGSVLSPGFLAGPEDGYYNGLGATFLGRPATADEMAHWQWMDAYEGGRLAVTLQLARSDGWAGGVIDRTYTDVLGRSADTVGRRYWLELMRSGLSVQRMMIYFYGSQEYYLSSGSPAGYVGRLYQALLQRAPDQAGGDYWTARLTAGGAGPADVASGFVVSPESRRRRVTDLYQRVLGRGPDEAGREYWVDQLNRLDDVALAAELAASNEFHDRVAG